VKRVREARRGECRSCGSCCDLTFHCPFLDPEKTLERCTHYEKRSRTCRDFPIDALDLWLTRVPCGYWFEGGGEKAPMRIPLARYGIREIVVFGGLAAAGMVLSAVYFWYLAPAFAVGLGFVLFFFRDPERRVPSVPDVLVSPADGKVVEIGEVDEREFLGQRAHRVGIFMSPLNVHVNRAPCDGEVEAVAHRPGRFLKAYKESASSENERTSLVLRNAAGGRARIVVRQIAGVLARRIVCDVAVGDRVERGQRFGMVKFGSRAEVYVPADSGFEWSVRVGQRVRGGETVLGVFR
jgi:phosphatidylserine decarboxylase